METDFCINSFLTILPIGISFFALAISAATFFLVHVYKKVSATGNIRYVFIPEEEDNKSNISLKCSIGNTGNQELLVTEIDIKGGAETPVIESSEIPIVIRPGEIKLISFLYPIWHLKQQATRKQKAEINFLISTADGKEVSLSKVIDPHFDDLGRSDWFTKPFKIKEGE
jgi:hypothetical protein